MTRAAAAGNPDPEPRLARLRRGAARIPRSLLGQLALALALVAAVSFASLAVLIEGTVRHAVWTQHERGLRIAAEPLLERLEEAGAEALRTGALPAPTRRRFDPVTGSMRFALLDGEGRVVEASSGAQAALPVLDPEGQPPDRFESVVAGSRIWGISEPVATPDGPMVLQVAQDMGAGDIVLDDVPASALLPIVAVLAAGTLLFLAVNLAAVLLLLRPLRRAAREAEAVRPGTAARLGEAEVPAEALPLIRAVNGALDRLEEALAQQRAFSLDVAHELRTPLAILLAEVDLLRDEAAASRLREDLLALARLVDGLLEAAEALESRPQEGQGFELDALCLRLAARLEQVGGREGRGIVVRQAARPLQVRGEAEAVGRALRNLVENALRHTAPGTAVEIRLREPGTVEVADRGPGLPPGDRSLLFRRLWRADRGTGGGAGLGLAIAQRIAEGQGGRIEARDNPGGGAVFALSLPPAAAAPRQVAATAPR